MLPSMISLPDPILLAVDGSPDARAATRAAADLALHSGAELHVVHVWQPAQVELDLTGAAGQAAGEELAYDVLDAALAELRGLGVTEPVAHLCAGAAADEILRVAEEVQAGLLVVGTRGLGAVQRTFAGSVSEGVVHRGSRPVLVLRATEHAWPPARLVIGDDASVDSRRAGELAAMIGHMFGTSAVVVRALSNLPRMLEGDVDGDARTVDDALRVAETSLARRARELEPVLGSRPRVQVAIDEPAAALISAAEDHGYPALIAVGTRMLGPLQRWRFGSVSTEVLRGAPGAVLINAHAN